jgi:hypothetical protein
MRAHEPGSFAGAPFLNLDLSLTLNPFGLESKIKIKIMITRENA